MTGRSEQGLWGMVKTVAPRPVYDAPDESITTSAPRERSWRPVRQQQGAIANVIHGGTLVIEVEHAMPVHEAVHRGGHAHAPLAGRPADPLLQVFGIRRVHEQANVSALLVAAPALRCPVPAEIPNPHSLQPEAANVVLVEGALGAVVEDRVGVQEHADRGDVGSVPSSGLPGRDAAASDDLPRLVRLGHDDAQLLDARIAIDDDQQLRPIDALACLCHGGAGARDP